MVYTQFFEILFETKLKENKNREKCLKFARKTDRNVAEQL